MHDLNFRSSQAESKIRIQKLDKTANRCNSRIHKYAKISLWIRYPSKIIPSTVNLFNPPHLWNENYEASNICIPFQTDSLKHSNEYQRLIYGQNFKDISKFSVCNDLS